jgi:iron complex transport system permease protein
VPVTPLITALSLLVVVSATLAVTFGPVPIGTLDVWRVIAHHAGLASGTSSGTDAIVWDLRAPRVILSVVVGAGLAVTGVIVQGTTRNPLADPYLLGLSAGASFGAVVVVAFGLGTIGGPELSAGAFLGALAAFVLVLAVAQQGRVLTPIRTVLAGVAIGELFSAGTSLLTIRETSADTTRSLLVWLLGGLSGTAWSDLVLPVLAVALTLGVAFAHTGALDALALGDDTARSLGFDADATRRRLLVAAALTTAVLVASCGAIGFVGLVIPHAARFIVGGRHRRVVPIAALAGALLMVWVDTIARTAFAPEEMPVGVITALVGAPFFILQLRRYGRVSA